MDNMKEEIINEICNDFISLTFLIRLKSKINDPLKKELLGELILFFSTIFCTEVINAQLGVKSEERNIDINELKNTRREILKRNPTLNSKKIKEMIKKNGVDFNEFVFDIVLTMSGNELINTNFGIWYYDKKENFLDGIMCTPRIWTEILLGNKMNNINSYFDLLCMHMIDELNNYTLEKETYSCNKMFEESNLSEDEKVYVLYRYGLLKNVLIFSDLVDNFIPSEEKVYYIKKYFVKLKSVIIEMVWNDYQKIKLELLLDFFKSIENEIPEEFFKINRKCRNNIHYSKVSILSEEEYLLLEKYQNLYLKKLIDKFDYYINIKLDIKHYFLLKLAEMKR